MRRIMAAGLAALFALTACSSAEEPSDPDPTQPGEADETLVGEADSLVVYSGRSEELVGPVFDAFTEATGIQLEVRYGDTAEMAAQILEEGDNSPADVYFGQDAGALGALEAAGAFVTLPGDLIGGVDSRYRSVEDRWVGITGRSRTVVYNPDTLGEDDLPDSILDFADEQWRGRVGWAPTNGSFQAFVTAMRELEGEDATREWLTEMRDLDTKVYSNNRSQVAAVAAGEIDAGLVNHYYAMQEGAANPDLKAANYFFPAGDPGALVNVAGAGILATSQAQQTAGELIAYLLGEEAQTTFAVESFEYPLVEGVPIDDRLKPLDELEPPDIDLANLEDLEGTLALLNEVGLL